MSDSLIHVQDVRKDYGGGERPTVQALRSVTLTIRGGEFVAITGVSGSGKSTLMHILGCLERPSAGTYRFAGRDLTDCDPETLAAMRRDVFGFIFQGYNLIGTASALENVAIPGLYAGIPEAERDRRASDLLTQFGLGERKSHLPHQLSGGEQQRVSIARALMNGGRVILADEPTGALDSQNGCEIMAEFKALSAAGHTVILVTHDRELANQAHRVIEVRDGRIVADTVREPLSVPAAFEATHAAKGAERGQAWAGLPEAIRTAWRVMWIHRIRTSLTLFGIVIGIASVFVMLCVGAGAHREVMQKVSALGAANIYVMPMRDSSVDRGATLTLADAEALREVPNVRIAMPFATTYVVARNGNIDHRAMANGVTTDFPVGLNWKLSSGLFFDSNDERSFAKVAAIGQHVKRSLFPDGSDPIGRTILLDNVPFEIIGVLEPKGSLTGDPELDNAVVMPYGAVATYFKGTADPDWILISIDDVKSAAGTEQSIVRALSTSRGAADFRVYNSAEAARMRTQTENTMNTMLGLIAAVSLVVGGIGVMNVMLMAMRERMREIGIRMAVGARHRDIMQQFLIEAVLITAVGGAVGIAVGLLIGALLFYWGVAIIFSFSAMALAFCCAVATGLTFGYAPARRAAQLHPIAALNSE